MVVRNWRNDQTEALRVRVVEVEACSFDFRIHVALLEVKTHRDFQIEVRPNSVAYLGNSKVVRTKVKETVIKEETTG